MLIFILGTIAACSNSDCGSTASKFSLTHCTEVFGGEYQACSGPTWNHSRTDKCDEYDGYEVSLEMVISPSRSTVVDSVQVNLVGAPMKRLQEFHADILMVNEEQSEVCFNVSDPPVCMKVENPLGKLPSSDATELRR